MNTAWRGLLMLLVMLGLPSLADAADNADAGKGETDAIQLADAELLEFIADWQTADGDWIDPLSLDDARKDEEHNDADE